jgi:hypothetical protein
MTEQSQAFLRRKTSAIRASGLVNPYLDRRHGRRYPVDAKVHYKALERGETIASGDGRLVNMSSSGVLVELRDALKRGTHVELSIAWPVRLNGDTAMQLWIDGTAVRTLEHTSAVWIGRYEFRTRGTHGPLCAAH